MGWFDRLKRKPAAVATKPAQQPAAELVAPPSGTAVRPADLNLSMTPAPAELRIEFIGGEFDGKIVIVMNAGTLLMGAAQAFATAAKRPVPANLADLQYRFEPVGFNGTTLRIRCLVKLAPVLA
ncbi:MAG TPA: hypothetical protein VJK08_00170 [Patescibacteria group bacterium]|nr:hypothetical protein [Patescibacteria group bacterium]